MLLAVLGHLAWLLPRLLYPSLALDYPFVGGDTFDWLANGLHLAGADVRYSGRLPLLPLLVAAAEGAGLLRWLPLVLQLFVHATLLGLYATLRREYSWFLALGVSLAWLLGFTWRYQSAQLMADVLAACLLAWALFLGLWAQHNPRWLPVAGLCGGLSAITQPVAWLLPLAVAAVGLWRRRWPQGRLAGAFVAFLVPSILWWILRSSFLAERIDVEIRQWGLLGVPSLQELTSAAGYYLIATLRLLGWPAMLLAVVGLRPFLRRARANPWGATLLLLLAGQLVLFVAVYGYRSQRFMVYSYLPVAFLVAAGLSRLPRPVRAAGVVALLVGLWMPLPGSNPAAAQQIALWPIPPIYLDLTAQPSAAGRLQVLPWRDLWRASFEDRVHQARHQLRTLQPNSMAIQVSADLLLLVDPTDAPDRVSHDAGRLSTHLRKRVATLPTDALLTPLAGYDLALQPAGAAGRWQLYRATPPTLGSTWLLAAEQDSPADRRLQAWPAGGLRPDPNDLSLARQIAQNTHRATPVLLSSYATSWRRWLPFLLSAREPLAPTPAQGEQIRQLIATAKLLDQQRLGPVQLSRIQALDRHWLVLETAPDPAP